MTLVSVKEMLSDTIKYMGKKNNGKDGASDWFCLLVASFSNSTASVDYVIC